MEYQGGVALHYGQALRSIRLLDGSSLELATLRSWTIPGCRAVVRGLVVVGQRHSAAQVGLIV